jgi:hypothetical protein
LKEYALIGVNGKLLDDMCHGYEFSQPRNSRKLTAFQLIMKNQHMKFEILVELTMEITVP